MFVPHSQNTFTQPPYFWIAFLHEGQFTTLTSSLSFSYIHSIVLSLQGTNSGLGSDPENEAAAAAFCLAAFRFWI
ncbi:ORF1298 [White spot syndrome virus]|uniref:Wsv506 n=4 Tax=White spot syndrome virus TaxID=342409 RepID=Q8VAB9_WSSVS|nr:wsv506 [Shrimp white spot syndrome virus]ATU83930.1 ORF1298 [White spot syndrome virus]AAL33507.1 wsv506 [Shrimp white spot syndrome virus]AAL88899.1 WSSV031 [Shrimp white spot syndrome virus]AWQ60603.1 wsv506 [Shrimp white spot syndrome virus]AWQ61040.1 wsv506 [Shrimp white spot syndrome virus]